jgi:hypothetical protein
MNQVRRTFSLWSLATFVLAIPVWMMVFRGSVMSRDTDGGIFLSASEGVASGLKLYDQIWENHDPFLFAAMSGAGQLSSSLPFFMDLMWIALASVGVWLLARTVMSQDRALFLSLVVSPLLLTGPVYSAGWSNTPGTALTLLAWGLFSHNNRSRSRSTSILSGIALGLLAFTKLTLFPVAILGLLMLLVLGSYRLRVLRTAVATLVTLTISIVILNLLGWWSGYLDMLTRNQKYASDVIKYFGFEDSWGGHLEKLNTEMDSWLKVAIVLAVLILVGSVVASFVVPRLATSGFRALTLLAVASLVGILLVLAATYVWPHHAQAFSLPLILAAILIAALVPANWPQLLWFGIVIIFGFYLCGWGTPANLVNHFNVLGDQFDIRSAAITEEPIDATLLNTVPIPEFTFARLGTNDDRGFFGSVREGATLECPQFHVYDFSPAEAFARQLDCIQGVDVILKTTNFDVFANGMNAANVQPILDYVAANFDCLTVNDRQLCTRH